MVISTGIVTKPFYFLCTSSRPSCDDPYLRIGKIRKCDYWCFYKTKYSNAANAAVIKKVNSL